MRWLDRIIVALLKATTRRRTVAGLGESASEPAGEIERGGVVFHQKRVIGRLERVVVHDDRRKDGGRVGMLLKAGRFVVRFDATGSQRMTVRVGQIEIDKAVHARLGGGELLTAGGQPVTVGGQQKVLIVVVMVVRTRMVRVLVVRVRPSVVIVIQIIEAVERAATAAGLVLIQIVMRLVVRV